MSSFLKSPFIFLLRNWKSGELQLMCLAILISVICITSLVFINQNLQDGLSAKTGSLLGSDAIVASPTPIDPTFIEEAHTLDLKTSSTISFLTMLVSGEELTLAEVKALGKNYPLEGKLRVASALFGQDEETDQIPIPGTIWVEPRIFPLLKLQINDKLTIGSKTLQVTRILTRDPDRTLEGISWAPRVLMNEQDVPATNILLPGSRVSYKLLLAGSKDHLKQFETWLKSKLNPAQSFLDARESRSSIKTTVDRVDHFLGLAFLINVSLAGIAIFMVTKRFSLKQMDTVALLRCFGASRSWILVQYLSSLLLLGLLVGMVGIGLGIGLGWIITVEIFRKIFLSADSITIGLPAGLGLLTVLVLQLGFALAPILDLGKVPPLRVLRRDLPITRINSRLIFVLALVSVAALVILQTHEIELTAYLFLLTALICIALLFMIAGLLQGLILLSRRLGLNSINIRNLSFHRSENSVQILAFALVFCLVCTLYMTRSDLLKSWEDQIPSNAPNYFAINIPPNEIARFQALLQQKNISRADLYPMILGRLLSVNQEPVEMGVEEGSKKRVLSRFLNLSWTGNLPAANQIISGHWFTDAEFGQPIISIEKGFADRMEIKLGDSLQFQIADKTLTPVVNSIRSVEWDSFRPNFFVLFPPKILEDLPITYMTSFYLPPREIGFLKILATGFPTVNIIDTQMILSEVKSFLGVAAIVVQYLFMFTLVISFILLFASIYSTLDERIEESTLLRILGISHQKLRWILLSEFLMLGLLAGVVGAVAATGIVYWLSRYMLDLAYHFNGMVLIVMPMIGMLLVGLGGWFGTRHIFSTPPLRLLSR